MVLKDIYCTTCEASMEMALEGPETKAVTYCKVCKKQTEHETVCNGGTKTLALGIGLDNRDFGDSCRFTGLDVEIRTDDQPEGSGVKPVDANGNSIQDKINNPDRIGGLRDKMDFEHRQKKGKTKLFFG